MKFLNVFENLYNRLIISTIGGGKDALFYFLLVICALCACSSTSQQNNNAKVSATATDSEIPLSTTLLHSRDSLLYYAERAYTLDDAKGQYVIAAASYLQRQGEIPPELYTIDQDEADTMLMRSAAQGYQPAIESIRCLKDCGMWRHE